MDCKQAMEWLSNGHAIITPDAAEQVCQAVGAPFDRKALVRRYHSDPPGTPKGLTMAPGHEGGEGVWTLELSECVARKLGVADQAPTFFGRGSQARAYAEAIAKGWADRAAWK